MGGKPKTSVPHKPAVTGRVLGYLQVQILAYINQTIADEGMAPSYSMIRDRFHLPTNEKVRRVVVALEKRGLLRRVGSCRVRGIGNRARAQFVRRLTL